MRQRTQLLVAMLAGAVAACGTLEPAPPAPSAPLTTTAAPLPIPPELQVPQPKVAAGIPPCDLLTREQLLELGLEPGTARSDTSGRADACAWGYANESASAGLTMTAEPGSMNLSGLYATRDTFARFEPTTIAGHPAVRGDDTLGKVCTLYVAVSDEQLMTADGDISGRGDLPDPCAPSRRIAEFVLSNLPPKP